MSFKPWFWHPGAFQIVYEQEKYLEIQIWDSLQHINWHLQFERYQILEYSAFSVTKISYPKISGQHARQTSAIMGLLVDFQNFIYLFL